MVLRDHAQDEATDGVSSEASSTMKWDCGCGRTIMEFSSSASTTVQAELTDEQ